MDPVTIAAIGAAVSLVSGLIGKAIAEGDYAKARALKQQIVDQYGDESLPVVEDFVAQEVGPSEFAKIQESPELRNAQVESMRQLAEIGSGKLTANDEAALQLANQGVARMAGSRAGAQQQQLAARGIQQGSGLAAALGAQADQDVTNASAGNRLQVMSDARERAFRALQAGGQMAGQVRGDDYRAASQLAGSQNAINQFNAGQRSNNQANNANLAQQRFARAMALKQARGSALGDMAEDYYGSGQRTENTAQGIGDGLNSLAGGIGKAYGKK